VLEEQPYCLHHDNPKTPIGTSKGCNIENPRHNTNMLTKNNSFFETRGQSANTINEPSTRKTHPLGSEARAHKDVTLPC
jgi:hypothetical protein